MSLILSFLLAATSFTIYGKNGETGILIGVETYQLSYQNVHEETLRLCDQVINTIYAYHDAGYTTHIYIKDLGNFRIHETHGGLLNIYGYNTVIQSMDCSINKALPNATEVAD